ncbi:lysylphosphatidylglycerol synthase transmembrane domain-containing protein [Flavobacterium dauae]|uniref:lysylphosphatidylglycerol synthase transmembrane domain-containing protein n=1 Tax=Flavobacterium dauae TaxID=1563479 RepID=UPI00101B228D|nr:lysylphosphatidylglycerol synthase transmembrane domain-containing protein [Flavobacterium dauae]WLD23871.1 lysylphosphatidylglycerol synthase transmembrane domain-containing protein [Flavobacterium dauae]
MLGVFLVYYAYNQFTPAQITEMKSYFVSADYFYIGLSLLFMKISHASRAYRWKYSLQYLGYQSNFWNNFMAIAVGYLLNLTIPRSGELSRAAVLQKYDNIPFDKGFGTIIAERIIDLLFLLLFVATALLLQYKQLMGFITQQIPVKQLVIISSIFILSAIIGLYLLYTSNWKFFVFIRSKISGLIEGVLSIFKMPHRIPFLIHTFIIWISFVLTFYFGTKALPETSSISLGVTMVAFVVGSLAISFTNGGIGAFPLLIAKILALYGISLTAGTAFGWILWTTQTLLIVIMGGLSFLILPVVNKNK